MDKKTILAVDDTPSNLDMLADLLDAYDLIDATSGKDALEIIAEEKIDLILLDIEMPEMNGFEVCRRLKLEERTKDIPIIFLTAHYEIEYIQKGFEIGGADYINKPFNAVELRARVKTHLQNRKYLEEIKQKQAKLAQLSVTDPLTKLYNNLFFETQIKTKMQQGKPFWIVYIKIDNFDRVNEVYGYLSTNKIVRSFAQILLKIMMKSASVSRIYDGSFCVILQNIKPHLLKKLLYAFHIEFKKTKDLEQMISYSVNEIYVDKSMTIDAIFKYLQSNLRDSEQS